MDTLGALLQHLNFNAEVFFSGNLCGIQTFDKSDEFATLHFLRSGSMTLITGQGHEMVIDQSAVLFFPDGLQHRFIPIGSDPVELVCATVKFQPGQKALLAEKLPKFLCIHEQDSQAVSRAADQLFEEAFKDLHARQMMVDRLCDVLMIQMLRYAVCHGIVELAMLAGSTHPALSTLMQQLRQHPEKDWSLEEMATDAAMSRSKFAALFKETVGQTPLEYLTDLRLHQAQVLLKKNKPVSLVANSVGYENASSLSRVFKKRFGITPKQWLKQYFSDKE